ncbi:MAG: hypothetical protein M5U32_21410 [Myxococcota bacterium]|nr:hypothetical protein [Myxococcota bacterium]
MSPTRRSWPGVLLAGILLLAGPATGTAQTPDVVTTPEITYDVDYEVRIVPTERSARVTIRITDPSNGLLSLRFRHDPERHVGFSGDGDVLVEDQWVAWTPPKLGGRLRYTVRIDHLRNAESYDSRSTRHWALLRGDALVPPASVRTDRMAHSVSKLRLRLPEGWSAVLPYERVADGLYAIDNPRRRFDRPVGWMLFGRLGVVRERVAGTRIAIGGPVGQGMRRKDQLALLRWTLPALREIAPLPERIAIVGAADPMWRGGLSGPNSAYLHASLPLISEDGTSPLLHEMVHVWMGARSGADGDWIVEGSRSSIPSRRWSARVRSRNGVMNARSRVSNARAEACAASWRRRGRPAR